MASVGASGAAQLAEIYLAGGCFWGVEEYFSRIPGVIEVESGYANGKTDNPTYREVCSGNTGHAETVRIVYDPALISLPTLVGQYFRIIDPTSVNRQGNDVGTQYRTGIYYTDAKDLDVLKGLLEEEGKKYPKPLAVELKPLENYSPAEECHQDYLRKNPGGYCHIGFDDLKSLPSIIDATKYRRPADAELKDRVSAEEYAVMREKGTEAPFSGKFWNNKAPGVYVDAATGEPLFLSGDKFDSGTGWPSFVKPVDPHVIKYYEDTTHGMNRVEVRSRVGNTHLGHVFNDGPKEKGGLRYCINSAALKFVPLEDMDREGYGNLKNLIK